MKFKYIHSYNKKYVKHFHNKYKKKNVLFLISSTSEKNNDIFKLNIHLQYL